MSIRDEIAADFQRINLQVLIAGRQVPLVVGADTSAGVSQINSQATIHLTQRPSYAVEGASCEVWVGYNSAKPEIIFRGELTGVVWEYFPGIISLPARDALARTRMEWGGDDREYPSTDDAALIRNALEAMGIPSSNAHIESSGWTMGVVEVVVLPSGRAFWSMIEETDTLAGYRTYTDRAGVVRRMRVSGNVGVGAAFDYSEGVNIIKATRRRAVEGIVNKCIVTGLTYEGLQIGGPGIAEAQADNPFISDPPRYIAQKIQSNLVEDDAKALEIAQRTVSDKNRRPEIFELEVIGNPLLEPLSVIGLTHADLEAGSGLLLVDRVQHTIRAASFRTSMTTLGGNINATVSNIAPIAAFDVKLFQEGEDTGSGVTSLIIGIADGSASSDPDGTSVTYAWVVSVDAGTVTPTTGTDAVMRFAISGAATAVTVELTVTDAGAATGVLTRVIPLDGTSTLVEPLYTAEGTIIAATSDGEQTWAEYTIPGGGEATCLMPLGPSWGMLWGASNGHIYATIDKLATAAVDLGAPHGAVACTAVWINEVDSTRAWAGFADGKVYSGVITPATPSAVWTLAGTTPATPIYELRESVGALGDLRATAGAGYYHSADGGASWTLLHTFSQAWRMAAGFDLNIASGLNDAAPLVEEGGATPTVPALVTHIRALAFGWRMKELYATDDGAALYTTDDTLSAFTLHADALPSIGNHMIRSGSVDRVVYIACGDGTGVDNGAVKWIPGAAAPWFIRKTMARKVYMIGYGPSAPPVGGPFELLLIPYGASGGDDFIWKYGAAGWVGIAPPVAGWYWEALAVNPFDQNEWLLYGVDNTSRWASAATAGKVYGDNTGANNSTGTYSPLWRTTDAGATWTEVILSISGNNKDHIFVDRTMLAWSDVQSGVWWLMGRTTAIYNETFVWRGLSGSSGTVHRLASTSLEVVESGADGDFVVSTANSPYLTQSENLNYITSAFVINNVTQQTGDTPTYHWLSLDRLPGSRSIVGYRTPPGNMWGIRDYRMSGGATGTAGICASNGASVSAAWSGVYTSGTGIEFIADPFAGGTPAQVGSDSTPTSFIRVGRRRRLTIAAVTIYKGIIVGDGATFRTIVPPPVGDISKIAMFCEVIEL
jgi:hypothetical protein